MKEKVNTKVIKVLKTKQTMRLPDTEASKE